MHMATTIFKQDNPERGRGRTVIKTKEGFYLDTQRTPGIQAEYSIRTQEGGKKKKMTNLSLAVSLSLSAVTSQSILHKTRRA